MIALESALTDSGRSRASTERLRTRVAHIMGGSLEERRDAYNQTSTLYDIRSALVHAGTSTALGEASLNALRTLVRGVLTTLLTKAPFKAMQQEGELEAWFADQLLVGTAK